MPTIASSVVPPPKSWDEFEDIALAAAKIRWNSDVFFRYGRQGQKQNGVDIWGDDEDRHIGVQCKNSVDGITLALVEAEIANAETFKPPLTHLYIATTAKRDATLQKDVRQISWRRRAAGQFRVDILFWDDVCQDLAKDDDVFFAHYPQFRMGEDRVREHDKQLFEQLTGLLRSNGVIGFIDRQNMGFSFRHKALESLHEFYYEWNQPEREFLNRDIEDACRKLWHKTDEYLEFVAEMTFPSNHNSDMQSIPPEWEYENPDRFFKAVKTLHALAKEIVALHADLVRTGKRILIGAPPAA